MADTELFRDAAFRVSVPTCPDGLQLPAGDDDDAVRRWLATLESQNERSCCFYDETLFYLCQLTYRTEASSDAAVRSAFERVCNAVKITTQCSFLPRSVPDPQQRRRSSGPSMHPDRLSSAGSTVTLGASKDTIQNLGLPPDTPNPMPGTQAGYAQYAQAAGVQVWEGGLMPVLASNDDDLRSGSTAAAAASGSETRCVVLKSDEALVAYWIGRVPLAFANVDMRDPLLAVTCHVTLRGSKAAEVDDMNVARSNKGGVGDGEETVTVSSIVGMQDALAGLGGASLPSSRLKRLNGHVVEDPSISTPLSIMRPEPALALRKSYRSILPLYSALTVKMRTLPTPIPFTQNSADVLTSDGLMSTICIEIEPGHVQPDLQFQVTNVRVSTRQSEGAYVSTNIDQLLAAQQDPDTYFPFQLERFAQHNLVYNIITSPSLTAGHLQTQYLASDRQVEHLRIDVDGFVTTLAYNSNNGHRGSGDGRVTSEFTSTWNTVLELRNAGTSAQSRIAVLRPIHDPTAVATDALPLSAAARSHSAQTTGSGGGLGKKFIPRNGSALHRDLVVSLSLIENSKRPSSSLSPGTGSPAHPYHRHAGLEQVTAYDTVDAEVTILNVSGRTVRLVLSDVEGPGSDRSQGGDPLPLVAGNQRSLTDLATPAPTPPARKPIIMLQNDLKLAPLLPRSCQSVRLRFMPLVPGPQRIPAFRLSDFERDQQVELQFEMYLQVK